MSELVEQSGVPLSSVKFYIREGLLPQGNTLSRTQAEYDQTHVQRLRLIRVLRDTVGLPVERVRIVLGQIDNPSDDITTAIGTAMAALPPYVQPHAEHEQVERLLERLEWRGASGHPVMDQVEEAIAACRAAGLPLSDDGIDAYARLMHDIARLDVAGLPVDRGAAVETAVVGTAVGDMLLIALRRLAQLQVSTATK